MFFLEFRLETRLKLHFKKFVVPIREFSRNFIWNLRFDRFLDKNQLKQDDMPSIKKLKFLKIVILEQGVISEILSEIPPFVFLFQITKKNTTYLSLIGYVLQKYGGKVLLKIWLRFHLVLLLDKTN